MSKDAEIEIAVNNHYFFSNVFTDDLVIHTTDNTQRIHIGTLQDKEAALTINSNTLYANSNMYVARRLGVGKTSNAAYSLDVQGDIALTGLLYKDGLPYSTGSSTWSSNNANTITWYNNGVVGVGTSNPQSKFHIMGSNAGSNFNAMLLQNSNNTGVAINFQDVQGTGSIRMNAGSLQLYTGNAEVARTTGTNFVVSGGFLGVNTANPARPLHVDGRSYFTSNVGIGTSNPAGLLDVAGSIFVGKGENTESNTTNGIYFKGVYGDVQTANSNYPHAGIVHRSYNPNKSEMVLYSARSIQSNEGPDKIRVVGGAIQFQTYRSNLDQSMLNADYTPVETGSALSTALYINSNGYVGIGTSEPQKTLQVSGEASVAGDLMVTSNVRAYRLEMQGIVIKKNYGGETNFSPYTYPGISNENAGILSIFTPTDMLRIYTNYSNEVVRVADYQLALNTQSNIDAYLKIQSTQDPLRLGDFVNLASNAVAEVRIRNEQSNAARLVLSQPNAVSVFGISEDGTSTYVWNSNANASFQVGTGGQERLTITAEGDVGIGTSNPQAALEVVHTSKGVKATMQQPKDDLLVLSNFEEMCVKVDAYGTVGLHTSNLFNMNTKFHLQAKESIFAYESNLTQIIPQPGSAFGYSVSISSNKDVIAVGAPYQSSNGACYVYKYIGSQWNESVLPTPVIGSNAQFGFNVAMNANGTRLIVGAPQYNTGSNLGAAFVFDYDPSTLQWGSNTVFLSSSNASSLYGYAVGISSDGNVVAVGDPFGSGSASIYRANNQSNTWNTYVFQGLSNSSLGESIDISKNGDVVVVGAPKANNGAVVDSGVALVYRWNVASNTYLQDMLVPGVPHTAERLAKYVSMSAEGNRIAVSGRNFDSTGRVVVFDFDGLGWSQIATILNDDASDSNYTLAQGPPTVQLVHGTNDVVIGWKHSSLGTSSNQGKVTLFKWTGSNFLADRDLTQYHGNAGDAFGTGISVSDDGKRIVVGSPFTSNGSVSLYDLAPQKVMTIDRGNNPILYVQHDAKVGIGIRDPIANLHVAGDVMFGKAGTSNAFSGGPFYKQGSWDTPQARHVIAYTDFTNGDNTAGTLHLQAANKSSVNPKLGNTMLSYLKPVGSDLDVFVMNVHKMGSLTSFVVTASNNHIVVNTDSDCSISWTSIGSY